jgi:hypothetical protein
MGGLGGVGGSGGVAIASRRLISDIYDQKKDWQLSTAYDNVYMYGKWREREDSTGCTMWKIRCRYGVVPRTVSDCRIPATLASLACKKSWIFAFRRLPRFEECDSRVAYRLTKINWTALITRHLALRQLVSP